MKSRLCFLALVFGVAVAARAAGPALASYHKFQASDRFFSEGAAFGDFNHDGIMDVASGPYWYAGPDFTQRTEFYPAAAFDPLKYSDNFFAFTHDFNGDGWTDILVLGFPGVDASWFENPGPKGGAWRRHVAFMPVDNESPTFGDLLKNGQPALICMHHQQPGYATYDKKDATRPWKFHPVAPANPSWQRFTHGLGFGDINGDGRNDLLDKDGWWEQPASLAGDPLWQRHAFPFSAKGGSQMHVYDVNGDGRNDVITAKEAHGYGISWFEQTRDAAGAISFKEHVITSVNPTEKIAGVQFSQPHALELADFDGDGLLDIVTGKRWWAHGPHGDVDPEGTPVLYAFLLRRGANGEATFEPHLIDDASGVGTQVMAADINHDGRADIVVGNKRGTFVFVSEKAPAKP